MHLGSLSETVILIDAEFLNENVREQLKFYTELYPEKSFHEINLTTLLYTLAANARISEAGRTVDVIFAYRLDEDELFFCQPSNLTTEINETKFESDIAKFNIKSFFADSDETVAEHFVNLLEIIRSYPNVARLILVADNPDIANEIERLYETGQKSLMMIKRRYDSAIVAPIKWFDIGYVTAISLGLQRGEI